MSNSSLAVIDGANEGAAVSMTNLSRTQVDVLRDHIAKGTTDSELAYFLEVCRFRHLNPFAGQIYCVVRGRDRNRSMTIQTGIEGYRSMAENSGGYEGQDGPYWCGEDGAWKDVWLAKSPPAAAKVGILRQGFAAPVYAVVRYDSYVQMKDVWEGDRKTGEKVPTEFWAKMPDVMLAKCAEAAALRKAFPQELSGIYTSEEMQQADNDSPRVEAPRQQQRSAPARPAPAKPADPFANEPEWIQSLAQQIRVSGVWPPAPATELVIGPHAKPEEWTAALKRWAAKLPKGTDPLARILEAINLPPAIADVETGEVIEGEATEVAGEDPDDLPFD